MKSCSYPHLAFVESDTTMQFNMVTAGMNNRTMPAVALPYLACIGSHHVLIRHSSWGCTRHWEEMCFYDGDHLVTGTPVVSCEYHSETCGPNWVMHKA